MTVEQKREIVIDDTLDNVIGKGKIFLDIYEKSKDTSKPIYLIIDSAGGSSRALFTILNALSNSDCKIITINVNKAFGFAGVLFASGDERIMTGRAELMFQEVTIDTKGKMDVYELKNKLKDLEKKRSLIAKILKTKCGISRTSYEQKIKDNPRKVNAETALAEGFATKIINNL